MEKILATIQSDYEQLNKSVIDSLYTDVDLVENIGQYIIDAGGKRIRPVLVILCCRALSYSGSEHITLATIIEYIHTATLLHDDVVDLSSMRRGKPTANAKWGNAPSVLVGDFIYSRSFQLLVSLSSMDIMQLMSETTNRIAAGEVLQLDRAGKPDTSEAIYFDIIERKTAILFEAACTSAAILCKAPSNIKDSLSTYGYHVGIAFQLIDDYLDYAGDASLMGKNIGDDLAEGKSTLPLIYAMQQTDKKHADIIAKAIEDKSIDQIDTVSQIIKSTNALEDTLNKALEHKDRAHKALDKMPDNLFKDQLKRIADLSVSRVA